MKNYYLVETMCGHVGNGSFIPITFPIVAENGKDAAKIAREIPRVKHHNKYAILSVEKVDYNKYDEQRRKNNNDVYLARNNSFSNSPDSELSNRVVCMESQFHYPKRKKHSPLSGKKSTTIQLCTRELPNCVENLIDSSLMRRYKIS